MSSDVENGEARCNALTERMGFTAGGFEGPDEELEPPTEGTISPRITGITGAQHSIQKLEEMLEELRNKLDEEHSKNVVLERRFFTLASNHEEIIKIKDEYKNDNEKLKIENLELKLENTRLFSDKLDSKDRENLKLKQVVENLQRDLAEMQEKYKEKVEISKKLCSSYEEKILKLVKNLSIAEDSLSDTMKKLREQELLRIKVENEGRQTCEKLQREKEELLQLALDRGRQINTNQQELQKVMKQLEKTRAKLKEYSNHHCDGTVLEKRLQDLEKAHEAALEQIEIIKKEFDAYKKHMAMLLRQERLINANIRHVIDPCNICKHLNPKGKCLTLL